MRLPYKSFSWAQSSATLEILYCFFVFLCRGLRLERTEISSLACLRILFPRIQAITARFKFSDHVLSLLTHRLCRRVFQPEMFLDPLWPGRWSLFQCERRNTSYATGIARWSRESCLRTAGQSDGCKILEKRKVDCWSGRLSSPPCQFRHAVFRHCANVRRQEREQR